MRRQNSRNDKAFGVWLPLGAVLAGLLFLFVPIGRAGETSLAQRAETLFQTGKARYESKPDDVEAAWQFGRVAFDWAEFATSNAQRAAIAQQGIAACRKAVKESSNNAAALYYLALNLGQLARTKKLGALSIVDEMEVTFKQAIDIDPKFDHAGPERCLGLLYFEAPGWPTSIGSRAKAKAHLKRCVELAPDYPDNRLSLLEAYLHWGDKPSSLEQGLALKDLLPHAREVFKGEAWTGSWIDWDHRWTEAQQKLERYRSSR